MKIVDILTESIIFETVDFWIPSESKHGMGPCPFCKDGIDGYTLDIGDEYYYFDNKPETAREVAVEILSRNPTAVELKDDLRIYTQFMNDQTHEGNRKTIQDQIDVVNKKYRKIKKEAMTLARENLKNVGPDECRYCEGTGESEQQLSKAPSLNVANGNLGIILQLLGLKNDGDWGGEIAWKDADSIKRRMLMRVNNTDKDNYTRSASNTQKDYGMQKTKDDDGLTKISRKKGATMIDFGIGEKQVQSYVDRLVELLDYATKNEVDISWG